MNRWTQGTLAVALLAAVPAMLDAQEPEVAEAVMCTATVDVESIQAGEAATRVAFSLSSAIGEITGVHAGESGLRLSTPEDLEQVEMADEGEATVIEMSTEAPETAALWLSSLEVEPGTYELELVGTEGTCSTSVTVEGEQG